MTRIRTSERRTRSGSVASDQKRGSPFFISPRDPHKATLDSALSRKPDEMFSSKTVLVLAAFALGSVRAVDYSVPSTWRVSVTVFLSTVSAN